MSTTSKTTPVVMSPIFVYIAMFLMFSPSKVRYTVRSADLISSRWTRMGMKYVRILVIINIWLIPVEVASVLAVSNFPLCRAVPHTAGQHALVIYF